jgi:poly-gamma-glutamate system protein
MPARRAIIRVPPWLPIGVGAALTAVLGIAAAGGTRLPAWLTPFREGPPAEVERAAASATAVWHRAVRLIADARHTSPDDALIGGEISPLVTTLGEVEAKRVSASSSWPAAFVREFHREGLRHGDVVAASFSGSFPALNLAIVSAAQAMGLRLVAVSSVTASSFGATEPGFTWPEIEVRLVNAGVLGAVSAGVSAGGGGDRADDLAEDGRALARAIAARCARELGAAVIDPGTFDEAVRSRLALFDGARGRAPLAAFVNVGGTQAALGRSTAILKVQNGWLPHEPFDGSAGRGLVALMVDRGVPVLHILNVRDLALKWGIL